ncbi:MAG: lipid-A-disaccharide synthase N-terminal domain-containing protein [Alphaproteobacteria bacterium]|nr:lipid-A-disaccharide synthase N-terminal domain-containing protein [Alphaproteobacteria bacterium]
MLTTETIWLSIGFLGQLLFSGRFIAQWLVSEREGRSVIPLAFWLFSLAGGATLLSYAIYRLDPVFIVGQVGGLFIYSRNLYFIWREHRARPAVSTSD